MKIKNKLNLAVLVTIAITLVISTLITTYFEQRSLTEQATLNAQNSINRLSITLSDPLWKQDMQTARNVVAGELGTNGLVGIKVEGSDGQALFAMKADEQTQTVSEGDYQGETFIEASEDILYVIQGEEYKAGKIALYFSNTYITNTISAKITSAFIEVAILVVVIWFALQLMINRIIIRPLDEMKSRIRDIAEGEGDLTQRVEIKHDDELGELAKETNRFIANVQGIIRELSEVVVVMDNTTSQGELTTQKLNESISLLTSEVQQIAEAMNEISQASREVSSQTSGLATILSETNELSVEGNEFINSASKLTQALAVSVEDTSKQMEELNQHSQKISSVVTVIENIAEQTNLLALNAAIEAARAGDHGRGFAVVSDEVRSLAQKTQSSVSEIVDIVDHLQSLSKKTYSAMNDNAEQMQQSSASVKHAGESFNSIGTSVSQNLTSSDMIATAAEEQSQTLDMIENNIKEILRVNEDARLVSETSAKINGDIVQSSNKLAELVAKFKI